MYKNILIFIIGVIISSSFMYIGNAIMSSDIKYENTYSGLSATTVQSAIDEIDAKSDLVVGVCPTR